MEHVQVTRAGSLASAAGPADYFTGRVRIDTPFRGSGEVQEIRQGDTVWIPPGVKHWHGAAESTAMSHIAIAEHRDGKVVDWMEPA